MAPVWTRIVHDQGSDGGRTGGGRRLHRCLSPKMSSSGDSGRWSVLVPRVCERCGWQFRADAYKVAHHPGEVRAGLFDLLFALRPGLGVVALFLPQRLKLGIERTFGAMTGWNRS
jgi:hypothetical protein